AVEATLAARQALDEESRLPIEDDRHGLGRLPTVDEREPVIERPESVEELGLLDLEATVFECHSRAGLAPGDHEVQIRAFAMPGTRPVCRTSVTAAAAGHGWRGHVSCGQLHGAFRSLEHRRLDVELLQLRLSEDPPALLGVRAVEAD